MPCMGSRLPKRLFKIITTTCPKMTIKVASTSAKDTILNTKKFLGSTSYLQTVLARQMGLRRKTSQWSLRDGAMATDRSK